MFLRIGAFIIFPISEQYSDERALEAGVVYPMLKIMIQCADQSNNEEFELVTV